MKSYRANFTMVVGTVKGGVKNESYESTFKATDDDDALGECSGLSEDMSMDTPYYTARTDWKDKDTDLWLDDVSLDSLVCETDGGRVIDVEDWI